MAARAAGQGKVWGRAACSCLQLEPRAHTFALVVSTGWFSQQVCGGGGGMRGIIDRCKQRESAGCERPGAVASALTHHQASFEMV